MSTAAPAAVSEGDRVMFDVGEAVKRVKAFATSRFDETFELAVVLAVDPRKPNQMVRGIAALPNGLGKEVRVAVFAKGPKAEEARAAGADIVGAEDLADQIKDGKLNFDRVIAAPDCMGIVGSVARILGPRGMMPNPKAGTITNDVAEGVESAKQGQLAFKTDRSGCIQAPLGKVSFADDALVDNITHFVEAIEKAKPSGHVGAVYFKKATVCSTMGPGVRLDVSQAPFKKKKKRIE